MCSYSTTSSVQSWHGTKDENSGSDINLSGLTGEMVSSVRSTRKRSSDNRLESGNSKRTNFSTSTQNNPGVSEGGHTSRRPFGVNNSSNSTHGIHNSNYLLSRSRGGVQTNSVNGEYLGRSQLNIDLNHPSESNGNINPLISNSKVYNFLLSGGVIANPTPYGQSMGRDFTNSPLPPNEGRGSDGIGIRSKDSNLELSGNESSSSCSTNNSKLAHIQGVLRHHLLRIHATGSSSSSNIADDSNSIFSGGATDNSVDSKASRNSNSSNVKRSRKQSLASRNCIDPLISSNFTDRGKINHFERSRSDVLSGRESSQLLSAPDIFPSFPHSQNDFHIDSPPASDSALSSKASQNSNSSNVKRSRKQSLASRNCIDPLISSNFTDRSEINHFERSCSDILSGRKSSQLQSAPDIFPSYPHSLNEFLEDSPPATDISVSSEASDKLNSLYVKRRLREFLMSRNSTDRSMSSNESLNASLQSNDSAVTSVESGHSPSYSFSDVSDSLSGVPENNTGPFYVFDGNPVRINLIKDYNVGDMSATCVHCKAAYFQGETNKSGKYNKCCNDGKINLPISHSYPTYFKDLICRSSPDSSHFMDNIRKFNSAVAFSSFAHSSKPHVGRGPYSYNIEGTAHHLIAQSVNPLTGAENENDFLRKYCQLYLLDTAEATEVRLMHPANQSLHYDIMENIHKVLLEVNPFASILKNMGSLLSKEKEKAQKEGRCPVEYSIRIFNPGDNVADFRGAFNEITANEVAIIYQSLDENEPPGITNRAIHSKASDNLQILPSDDPRIDLFSYPVFFPSGSFGWRRNMPLANLSSTRPGVQQRSFVTMQQYYRHALHSRPINSCFSPILFGGKLTDQFVCDARLRIESRNLQYLHNNQTKLRVQSYQGLHDHLRNTALSEGKHTGRVFVLPSTFVGGPRYMQGLFNDAMAMVTALGLPDLFITMTCNPNWPEIKDNLGFAKTPNERKDIVVRVFELKLEELIRDIVQRNQFGKVIGYTYSIEFQKRGLPHAHIIIILDKSYKPTTPYHVNKHVSAELPNEKIHPELFKRVREFMIHGPCGPGAVCSVMKNNNLACKKHFPKQFQSTTDFNVDSYPIYQRRDNRGMCENWKGKVIDNSWVVPYNPDLLMKFNCHINVEIISSVSAVKYIYKYCFKGPDKVSFRVVSNDSLDYDEIHSYKTGRYLCPTEAFWRIFELPTHDRSHTIARLPVHEELDQSIIFTEGKEHEAFQNAIDKDTQLTAYFKLNTNSRLARELFYHEIPLKFSWDKVSHCWKRRVNEVQNLIVRIHSVSMRDSERFSIRTLLLHRKGCESFTDLRTIDREICPTFRDAALKLGFITGENFWKQVFDEGVVKSFPKGLRDLLVSLSTSLDNTFVPEVWNSYQEHFIADFLHMGCSRDEACDRALQEISEGLRDAGKTLQELKLPIPTNFYSNPLDDRSEDLSDIQLLCSQLNRDQLKAVVAILRSVCRHTGKSFTQFSLFFTSDNSAVCPKLFFLDGPGGTGKTFIYNVLCKMFDYLGITYITVAPTGIAAVMLPGGRTAHSRFGIPIVLHNKSTSAISFTDHRADDIRAAKVVIWDEIGMTKRQMLDLTDRLFHDLKFDENGRRFTEPFGGCIIVAGGDFRQQGPVVKRGSRPDYLSVSVKSSTVWPSFTKLLLKVNMRAGEHQKVFNDFLLKVGENSFEKPAQVPPDFMHVPDEYLIDSSQNKHALIDYIFGTDLSNVDPTELGQRAILCPRNDDALQMNEIILSRLPGETVTIFSSDSCQYENDHDFDCQIEFLNSLTPSGCPPHKLNLKKNCVIMLLRNVNPGMGLVNGTRLIVKHISDNILDCEVLFGTRKGQRVFLPKFEMIPSDTDLPFIFKRYQFPVRLSYSMTIAKSQGQSLDYVGIYLNSHSFCHGQMYTAWSRSKFPKHLKIDVVDSFRKFDGKTYIKNIVFRELL